LNATAAFAGWRSIIEDSLKVPLVGEPQVTVLREGRVTVVRLKNATKTALQYSGYGSENPTTYWEEFRKGKWIQTHWPWCGTGLNDYSLAPGATISFRFSDDELKAGSRVYTIVRSVDGKRGSLILLCERLSSTKRSTE
jgi:hypothetical protein